MQHSTQCTNMGKYDDPSSREHSRCCRAILLLCVLVPLWMLSKHVEIRVGGSRGSTASAGVGGRRMLGKVLPPAGEHLKRLVLVAGHAVYVGRDYSEAAHESSWYLESYQKVPGEAQSFLDHIRLGIQEAAADPEAMLLFSGGQTRREAGPRSEGLSYWIVAEAADWFNITGDVRSRTFTEEHARDSFENLLFSICRFYELSGHYPEAITVVSYNLKRDRFKGLHRMALHYPEERFKFVGTELPAAAKGAKEGEARTVAAFKNEPYGCGGDLLLKRLRRDPFAVGAPHAPSRCPDLTELIQWCSPYLYSGHLPWA
mmetsp:Transcript_11004/g.30176  ORF Transcript_11004/g.30176 Transcript_11004/m.30176 type:complete len:315 (+) Transcript_11004:353-1297(+)